MSNIGSVTKTAPVVEESQAAASKKTLPVDRHLTFAEDCGVSIDPAFSQDLSRLIKEGADLRWGRRYVTNDDEERRTPASGVSL